MTSEEMHTALYEKFRTEQDNYRAWLLKQPPEEILRHSYEYSVREDIVMMMRRRRSCGKAPRSATSTGTSRSL